MRFIRLSVVGILLLFASNLQAGLITSISLGDFDDAQVLDFQSTALGNISGTASLFTDFGISSVSATASNFFDTYDLRPNSTRALWGNSSGLAVVDPNTNGLADIISYTLNLSSLHSRFGVGTHDQAQVFGVEFFSAASSVGIVHFTNFDADLSQVYYENTDAFDSVIVSYVGTGGFAIDNITLESTAVTATPEPTSMALLGLASVGGIGLRLRRNRKAQAAA